jgi:hypothetical protein
MIAQADGPVAGEDTEARAEQRAQVPHATEISRIEKCTGNLHLTADVMLGAM